MKNFKSNPRQTMLTIALGFSLIYFISLLKANPQSWALGLVILASGSGLFSLYVSKKIEWLWMGIAKVLSYIIPNLLLGLIYFLLLFPLALLNRFFSKKELLRLKNPPKTVWETLDKKFDAASMEHPW